MSLSPTSSRSSGSGGGSTALLTTATVSGVAGVLDVAGIPQTYNDLSLVCMVRSSAANGSDGILLRFNNDSGANYEWTYSIGANATMTVASAVAASSIDMFHNCPDTAATAGRFGFLEIIIPGYTSTTWAKVARSVVGGSQLSTLGGQRASMQAGNWISTAAINRVRLFAQNGAGTLEVGSTMRIYGRL